MVGVLYGFIPGPRHKGHDSMCLSLDCLAAAVEACYGYRCLFEHCCLVKHFIDFRNLSCFWNLDVRDLSATTYMLCFWERVEDMFECCPLVSRQYRLLRVSYSP